MFINSSKSGILGTELPYNDKSHDEAEKYTSLLQTLSENNKHSDII